MTKDLSWLRTLPRRPLVVAEVKDRSPYGWVNPYEIEEQLTLCETVGDIISVHTNVLWGGSFDLLRDVCQSTDKPVLAKGFHDTIHDVQRALDCGAAHVLTVGWHPGGELGKRCWFEVECRNQLINAPEAEWIVLNARCPRTGGRRGVTAWNDTNVKRVLGSVDRLGHRICQASMIREPEDVVPGVDAILIGEGLYTTS